MVRTGLILHNRLDLFMEALMAGQPLKFAVIGLGMASKPHLSALLQLADIIEVAGVYARNADRRKEVSDNWGWPQFESLEEIAVSDIDATLIITPPNARINVVKTIATAGKAILMEKPVERDLKRATELVEICEIANVPLGIVLQHRFRAGAEAMTTKIHSGEVVMFSRSAPHFHGGVSSPIMINQTGHLRQRWWRCSDNTSDPCS